jgi:hypothetical protein
VRVAAVDDIHYGAPAPLASREEASEYFESIS